MKKQDLYDLMNQPHLIKNQNEEEIVELAKLYPACSSLQLILCSSLFQNDSIHFEQQLRKTASYAPSRKKLHQLLYQSPISINEPVQLEKELKEKPSDSPQQVISTEIKQKEEKDVFDNEIRLEEQIISSAINSSILLEVSDELNPEDYTSLQVKEKIEEPKLETKEPIIRDPQHKMSFTSWLNEISSSSANQDSESGDKKIIPIKREKAEFYSPVKMARLSVMDDGDLVTETLANIYADQGHYEKAIQAFERLQLKYPEKKIYFAGRIQEITNQLNDN